MNAQVQFWSAYREDIAGLVLQHLLIVAWALPVAAILAVGAGMALADRPRVSAMALGLANVLTTVPSVALFGLMTPVLGAAGLGVGRPAGALRGRGGPAGGAGGRGGGRPPAILAVALYSVLPILRNTVVGLRGVPQSILEAASGMGMSDRAVLWGVRLPLASPVILAGVRTAVVMGIGITAIAAYVGAGGLGRWVFGGIRRSYPEMALAGALGISILAFGADYLLGALQAILERRMGLGNSAERTAA